MTFLINQAIFILLNTLFAGKDAALIKKDKTIDHLDNGLIYFGIVFMFVLIFKMSIINAAIFSISCLCNRQLFFDIPLNLLRKLKWDYVSPDPVSWFDKMEVKIWGQNGKKPNYFYASTWIITLLVNLIFNL